MKDVSGKEVVVGDTVAYLMPYYRTLKIGMVTKLTPKGVTLKGVDKYKETISVSRLSSQVSKID